MDNLHFTPNNILKFFFKELTKYKNDYQQYLNYIMHLFFFLEFQPMTSVLNYIMHLIVYL